MSTVRNRTRHCLAALVVGALASASTAATAGPQTAQHNTDDADSMTDADILEVANVANAGEVDQAAVALEKGQSPTVKQFADLMKKDHGEALDRGHAIGKDLKLVPTKTMTSRGLEKEGGDMEARLEKVSQETFDRTYLEGQIRLHERVLKLVTDLSSRARAPKLRALLADMKGHIEHHLALGRRSLASLPK